MRKDLLQLFQTLECTDLAWLQAAEAGASAEFQTILKDRSALIQKISQVLKAGQEKLDAATHTEILALQQGASVRQQRLKSVASQLRDESRRQWNQSGGRAQSAASSPYFNQSKGTRKSVIL